MKIRKNGLIVALFLLMAVGLAACGNRSSGSGIVQRRMGTGVSAEEKAEQVQAAEDLAESDANEGDLYIVTKIDEEQRLADFQKVTSGRQLEYSYDVGTRFLDKYGDTKSAASFVPGDVVALVIKDSEQKLVSVQLSDAVWVYDNIVNYTVDESINAFQIGQTRYAYDAAMDIFSGEERVDFASIGASDVLRAVGIGNQLISLAITKGHGYLALANTKLFEGSFVCVGDRIFEEVSKNMKIEVPEGSYLVTVANNGYGGSKEVVIERNQTTSLNLDELKGEGPQICKVTFDVGVEGASLFIDGKKADYSAPIELTYGVHTITVEAEGYDAITRKLVANSKTAEIEIALTESKDSETDSSEKKSSDENAGQDNQNANNTNNNTNNNNTNNNNNNNTSNNNNNGSTNGYNTNNNTNNNSNNGTTDNTSQTDYLTTLYNLLTSINNNNTTSNSGGNSSNGSNGGDSYDDLRDQ